MISEEKIKQYSKYFDKNSLFKKIIAYSEKAGTQILLYALILFYLISEKEIPLRIKLILMAALGYFILPADLISDLLPVLGFSDDLAFITYALTQGSDYITPEIQQKAKEKLDNIFKKASPPADKTEDNSWSDGVVWSEE